MSNSSSVPLFTADVLHVLQKISVASFRPLRPTPNQDVTRKASFGFAVSGISFT
jgi:hypothetical protein